MAGGDGSYTKNKQRGQKKGSKAAIATKKQGVERRFLDIKALIQSIQRAEGVEDCFGRAKGDCTDLECEWRSYCLDCQTNSRQRGGPVPE